MPPHHNRELAQKQIEFARDYTVRLISDVDEADWFTQPAECPAHLAWEIGHLAMAEYMLVLFRLRGKQPEDDEIVSRAFRKAFAKGSTPASVHGQFPDAVEIRRVFDAVHLRAMRELSEYTDDQLQQTIVEPYAVTNTTLGSLLFCAQHEMLHAGQIGLIRRMLGHAPRP